MHAVYSSIQDTIPLAESHRASGGIFATLRYGSSTLVVEVSDDDNDGEEDVDNDGERLHYDDASWRARYIL